MVKVKDISGFSMDLFKIDSKVAIVTSAVVGIGRAYC